MSRAIDPLDVSIDDLIREIRDKGARVENLKRQLQDIKSQFQDIQSLTQSKGIENKAVALVPSSVRLAFRKQLKGHFGKVHAVSWNPKEKFLIVTASQDGTLIVWNARRGFRRSLINLNSSWVMTCTFSPSGQLIACGGLDNNLSIYSAEPGVRETERPPAAVLEFHSGYLMAIEYISEKEVITGSGDATCVLWDLEHQRPKVAFAEHTSDVQTVSLRDENSFYSAGCDQTSRLWDIRTPKCAMMFEGYHTEDINKIKAMSGGFSFATGSDDASCKLFDIRCANQVNVFDGESSTFGGVKSMDFSNSGKILFAGYADCKVRAWDVVSANVLFELGGHKGQVSGLQVSQDGFALATGSWDHIVNIWA